MGSRNYLDAISINGVDVFTDGYVYNYRVTGTKKIDSITMGTIRLIPSVLNVLTISLGQEVIISRGLTTSTDQYLMRGYITNISDEDNLLLVSVNGRWGKLKRLQKTYSFDKNINSEGGDPRKIWETILTEAGYNASYVSTGPEIFLDKFICNDSYRFERMSELTKYLGFQQRDDFTNNVGKLEPVGYTTYDTVLNVGTNVMNIPIWEEDLESVRNFIKINGAYEEDTKTTQFSGTGTEDEFTVAFEPEVTKVTVGGVEQVRGILNSTAVYDYTVDKQLKKFTFVSGSIPASGTDNVVIEYTFQRPKPVQGRDYTSIELYGQERFESFDLKDIQTVADAQARLKQFLKYMAFAAKKTSINVYETPGIEAGYIIPFTNPNNNINNGEYIVNEITYQYPEPYDVLQIGSTDFSIANVLDTINQRLKLLEQSNELNTDELTNIIQLVSQTRFNNIYQKIQKATADVTQCILDHPTQSTLDDTYYLAGDTGDVYLTISLIPGNNTFSEYVKDSEFYDSSASTGITWNNTTNVISIAATTGVLISEAISIGVPYTDYKVILGTVSATGLTISISADGKSTWEAVTLETLSEFIESVSDVYIKIENTTAGSIDIEPIKNDADVITFPAIEVSLE